MFDLITRLHTPTGIPASNEASNDANDKLVMLMTILMIIWVQKLFVVILI